MDEETYIPTELATKIYQNIVNRINESWDRAEKDNINPAYLLAFEVGILSDIDDILSEKE